LTKVDINSAHHQRKSRSRSAEWFHFNFFLARWQRIQIHL